MKGSLSLSSLLLPALLLVGPNANGEVAPDLMAKFIKVIATHSGSAGRIDIKDPILVKALGELGVAADPSAKVAYSANISEVKALRASGKLVICNRLDLLSAGGSIAIVDEDDKATVYLHTAHISESGAKVSPAILRIGKQN